MNLLSWKKGLGLPCLTNGCGAPARPVGTAGLDQVTARLRIWEWAVEPGITLPSGRSPSGDTWRAGTSSLRAALAPWSTQGDRLPASACGKVAKPREDKSGAAQRKFIEALLDSSR